MTYDFEVSELAEQPVASIVIPGIGRAAVTAALGGALPDVFSHLHAGGVTMVGPPFARYHEGRCGTIDLEAGIPVEGVVSETDTIKARSLPGGEVVRTVHTGSYDTLPDAVQALAGWRTANGRDSAGALWEVYLDDPTAVPAHEVRTEVVEPLAPRRP